MLYICAIQIDSRGKPIKYFAFDSQEQRQIHLKPSEIVKNHKLVYGIKLINKDIKYTGYNYIPIFDLNGNTDNYNSYTLVGRIVKNRQSDDLYILVQSNGAIHKVGRDKLIEAISLGRITNAIQSTNKIQLRCGKLEDIKYNGVNITVRNTVKKIKDEEQLLEELSTIGVGEKFLAQRFRDGKYGMMKKSVSRGYYDNINEVLAFHLGKLFNVDVCEASFETWDGSNKDWVVSVYKYSPGELKIVSCKNAFGINNFHNNFSIQAIKKRYGSNTVKDFQRMIIFDIITRQTDRHIRNFSFIEDTDSMYPLYDNGRCLFWDIEDLKPINTIDIVGSIPNPEHGYGWNYIDSMLTVQERRKLINDSVKYEQIYSVVKRFYNETRSIILSDYMMFMYRLIMGGPFSGI